MPRFMLKSLSKSKQNLEIVEIKQAHRVIYFSSRTGMAARFLSVMTFPMVPTFQLCWFGRNIGCPLFRKYVLKLVGLRVFD